MADYIPLPRDLPVGFRFSPTDEELINYYLKNKVLGNEFLVDNIREIDTCKCEPWDLPGLLSDGTGYEKWFFFSVLDFKYSNSQRCNRTTKAGFWKSTGKDREIRARGTKQLIGTKKNLVFHEGRSPKGIRTHWVLHEYRLAPNSRPLKPFVVCRLKQKSEIVSTRNGIQEIQPNFQYLDYDSSHLQSLPDFYPPDREANGQPEPIEYYFNALEFLDQLQSPGLPASLYFPSTNASDECFDDATSMMRRSSPRYFQPANGNDGEVNNQKLRLGASESENDFMNCLNSIFDNENNDEVTSAIRIDSHNKEEPSNTLCLIQDAGLSSDNDNDRLMDLIWQQSGNIDHIAPSSCSSAVPSSLTMYESRRGPLPAKRFQYREKKEMYPPNVLGGSSVSCSNKKALKRSSCGSIASTSDLFSSIITTKRIQHKSSHPLVYVAKAGLGFILFVVLALEVLLYSH